MNRAHLCLLSCLLFFAGTAALAEEKPCDCWIDVNTGKSVPTIPRGGKHLEGEPLSAANPFIPRHAVDDVDIASDSNHAHNSQTGQTYVRLPNGSWIDPQSGKCVPTIPRGGKHLEGEPLSATNPFIPRHAVDDVDIASDPNHARNSQTGHTYVKVPCPPPTSHTVAPQPQTPSTTDKVTDALKTIGSSINIGVGVGGGERRNDGGSRTFTPDQRNEGGGRTFTRDPRNDAGGRTFTKNGTHTSSPPITKKGSKPTTKPKTVTSACKCHPCTCSPCTCH